MKTAVPVVFFLLCFSSIASEIKCRPVRGLNVLRTWENGIMTTERRQILSSTSVMYAEYRAWQQGCCDWTQRVYKTWYEGEAEREDGYIPRLKGTSCELFADGRTESFAYGPDAGALGSFDTGGSQGAMVVVGLDGYRTQIINASTLRVEWNTNDVFCYTCPAEDDMVTAILWYRDWISLRELPWFVGASVSLDPGQAKTVGIPTPIDTIWKHVGIDKCFGCSSPCWLAGWPKPASTNKQTVTTSSFNGLLHLNFKGEPGVTYAVMASRDLEAWWTGGIVEADISGSIQFSTSPSLPRSFFKIQAVKTATMNEHETKLAIQDLKEFWK